MSRITTTLAALAVLLGAIATTTTASPVSASTVGGDGSVRIMQTGVSGAPGNIDFSMTVTDTQIGTDR